MELWSDAWPLHHSDRATACLRKTDDLSKIWPTPVLWPKVRSIASSNWTGWGKEPLKPFFSFLKGLRSYRARGEVLKHPISPSVEGLDLLLNPSIRPWPMLLPKLHGNSLYYLSSIFLLLMLQSYGVRTLGPPIFQPIQSSMRAQNMWKQMSTLNFALNFVRHKHKVVWCVLREERFSVRAAWDYFRTSFPVVS